MSKLKSTKIKACIKKTAQNGANPGSPQHIS